MTAKHPNESQLLRHKLEDFMMQARQNERKLRRFQSFELQLISLYSLYDLLKAVLYPDYPTFKWDMVSLMLLDPEYEIQRILEDACIDLTQHPSLMFATADKELQPLYPNSLFPMLSPYRKKHHQALFHGLKRPPASVALLPLVRYGRLIGSLNIGSYSENRFIKGMQTDFFEHLSAIVAICLENAVNHERLKRQGLTDTLTAINNRRFFDQRLSEEVAAAKRDQHPLSCLLLDIDHFKQVNDVYGHQTGDRVLMEVAALIRAQMRGNDVLARYGGEEFSALLSQTAQEEAGEVAERIRCSIAGRVFAATAGQDFQVTISIGIATFEPVQDPQSHRLAGEYLVGQADRALYAAKAAGRNQVISGGTILIDDEWQMVC